MSNDPNIADEWTETAAAIRKISDETRNLPNPNLTLYDPASKIKILSKGTPEWEARQERDAQWHVDHPAPPIPHDGYYKAADGSPEWRFRTPEQLAETRKDVPVVLEFTVIVDGNRYGLLQGRMTRFFDSSDAVVLHCHRLSKGERSMVNFYTPPSPLDREKGVDTGDFIYSENFGG